MKLFYIKHKPLSFDTRVKALLDFYESIGLEVICIHDLSQANLLSELTVVWYKLIRLIFSEKRILKGSIFYSYDSAGSVAMLPLMFTRARVIQDVHDYEQDRAPFGKSRLSIQRTVGLWSLILLANRAEAVVTVSELMSRYVKRYWLKRKDIPVYVLLNAHGPKSEDCECGYSEKLEDWGGTSKDFTRIGFVGMKSKSRGSADVSQTIHGTFRRKVEESVMATVIDRNESFSSEDKLSLRFFWVGASGSMEPSVIKSESITNKEGTWSYEEIETPLLCKTCLSVFVSMMDLNIHAYRPDYANSRHALPNKIFSYVNSEAPIFAVGDLELKQTILNNGAPRLTKVISSHLSWVQILNELDDFTFSNCLETEKMFKTRPATCDYDGRFRSVNQLQLQLFRTQSLADRPSRDF